MAAGVELLTAYVSIVTESSKVAPEVKKSFGVVGKEADRAGRKAGSTFGKSFGSSAKNLLAVAGVAGIVSKGIGFLKDSNAEAREAQKVGAQTAAVIKSTGKAAGLSAKQFGDLATAISLKTGIDDEQIQSGENMLATFVNIGDRAGKNNKIFTEATKAATDLAVATKTDQVAANVLLGKSLNDPVKGLGRLTKIGVTFTDQQVAQVKAMAKVGNTAGAQRVILKELAKEFGGSAEAQATAGDKAAVAIGNLKEQIGTALLPVIDNLSQFVTNKAVPAISKFVSQLQDGTGAGGEVRDVLEDVYKTGKRLFKVIDGLPGPVKKFGVEALIAYGLFSKFSTLVVPLNKFTSGLTTATTRTETLAKATAKLKAGATAAAGTAGILAIYESTKVADKGMQTFLATAGGAATGFAVGGPLGAAVGGTAGLIFGLTKRVKSANEALSITGPPTSYAESLDQVSGAATRSTRQLAALALQKDTGLSDSLRAIGVSSRDMVSAILGQPKALAKVQAAIKAAQGETLTFTNSLGMQQTVVTGNAGAALDVAAALGVQTEALSKDAKQTRATALQTEALSTVYKGLPKAVITRINQLGGELTEQQIVALNAKYNLTPKQIKTALEVNNLSATLADIDRVNKLADYAARDRTIEFRSKNLLAASQGDKNKNNGRALGGPVTKGQPYIVGERRPELFIPNQSGRIVPRVPAAAGAGVSGLHGSTLILNVDGVMMRAVIDERVGANAGLTYESERAFG